MDPGDRVQIKCAGEGSPKPMLFWYKEGHRQLMFPPAASSQQQQHLPKSLDQWPQAAALVAPLQDPRFSSGPISTSDTSPSINKIFTMPITSDQIYPTSYSNNFFENRIYVDNHGTLNIINATLSDNGYYACALISSVSSVMATAKVTVKHSLNNNNNLGYQDFHDPANPLDPVHARSSMGNSLMGTSKYDLLPPPVIKLGAANQTLPTNTSATLVCEVVSQVAYKIQWYFNSDFLREDDNRVTVLDTGALSINDLRPSDSGVYTCVVTVANEPVRLSSPFEPLDSSMLTSAPPTQQLTSHSTLLKVASPLNPNIQFYRPDPYAVPSSPGPANLVSTNGNDAITINWAAPTESGALPIREYVVEHYDTSQENLGWRVIYRIKGKESLLIDGLSPEGSHFFVIRAVNGHGPGPSSPIAGPMRTVAGETRYQEFLKRRSMDSSKPNIDGTNNLRAEVNLARDRLMSITTNLVSLTPVSSTSIRLQWSTHFANYSNIAGMEGGANFPLLSTPDVDEFLEGYSIRYRAAGPGETKGPNWNQMWPVRDMIAPASLPLVTSYIDSSDEPLNRDKREIPNYFDYSQYEFNEVRVVDHNTEHYTINGLKPFTLYQFFVVPYYKDIDGVPSNILTAQTNEDRPTIAPPNLTARPINNTAVRLLWFHVPQTYANGVVRGYILKIDRSEVVGSNNTSQAETPRPAQVIPDEEPKLLNLPLSSLIISPSTNYNQPSRVQPSSNQQYIVMYDITNLTYKSFYKIQVAAMTSAGAGPWSETYNLIMEPKILAEMKFAENDIEDFLSKSLISNSSNPHGNMGSTSHGLTNYILISLVLLIVISVIVLAGYILYRKNNQKVSTWKKTISEHFTNKFYMPANVDTRPNSLQQNIYDHQQHLIYSGSTHMSQQPVTAQAMWANNNCLNSGGTESLKSHGILPINTDPVLMNRRLNEEQVLSMNNKDIEHRFVNGIPNHQLINQTSIDSSRSLGNQNQIVKHGNDYYSVINNMGDYEELDPHQRNNIQMIPNVDRHQTTSSNSDTSCPSSVTRLLPNQNYNRDLLTKNFNDNQRHEIVLQQHVPCNDLKQQPFATMINSDPNRQQSQISSLSPYATTNLMNQMPQQLFPNSQMTLIDHHRQPNFIMHNGVGMTMDDSSKSFMHHQQIYGVHNPVSAFRTLQRNPVSFQSHAQPQTFMQINNTHSRFVNYNQADQFHQVTPIMTNITTNPMSDANPNLYEHIDYSDRQPSQHQMQNKVPQPSSQASNDMISSSTSSGSMMSSTQQHSPDQHPSNSKFRRGSGAMANLENEAHDLRVFSSPHVTRQTESTNAPVDRQRTNGGNQIIEGACGEDDEVNEQVDETTAFRQKASQGDNQRVRQLSKRKRQQQRNRLHNNNQKID